MIVMKFSTLFLILVLLHKQKTSTAIIIHSIRKETQIHICSCTFYLGGPRSVQLHIFLYTVTYIHIYI